jgi:predicted N-formylglutamate amidohydrolase
MQLILTVPHSFCTVRDTRDNHTCDFTAEKCSAILQQEIERAGIHVTRFLSDTWRGFCDENRPHCRWLPFRRRVDASLNDATVLLDIHSFPPGDYDDKRDEIVLLYVDQLDEKTRRLVDMLRNQGVYARAIQGAWYNDVVETSKNRVYYDLLIEFNEDLPNSRIRLVCSTIVRWLLSFAR